LAACSESGGSARAASEQVGTTGKVIAVDLADHLMALAEAKAKAAAKQLENFEFRGADMLKLGYSD